MTAVTGERLVESRPIAYLEFEKSALIKQHILQAELSKEELILARERTKDGCLRITLTDKVKRTYETTFAIKDGGFLLYLKPPIDRLGLFTLKVVECKPITQAR